MTTARHRELITDLVSTRGAKTRHFRRELLRYIDQHDQAHEVCVPRCVPDAWRLDCDGAVTVWEVDITHHTSADKLRAYAILWADLDASEVADLDLRIVDRYGVEHAVDLAAAYYNVLATPRT